VAGHQPDGKPEDEITILGWASNFNIGTWGNEAPRACIFADLKFKADMWEVAKGLPRRSVELWTPNSDDAFIDPLALLSGTTPHRDLGLLYAKKVKESDRYIYSVGDTMNKDEMVKCFAEMLENSDIGKYVRDEMKSKSEDVGESEKEEDKPEVNDEADEVEDKDVEKEDDKEEVEDKDKEKMKNERDAERRKYARLDKEFKTLNSRLADLERRERVAVRKAELLGIEGEGVLFDMNEELETVSDMDSKSYGRHIEKMRKRYQKSPIGVRVPTLDIPAHGRVASGEITQDQGRAIAELIGKGKSKEEAMNIVRGA
jgi:hypothetical protein